MKTLIRNSSMTAAILLLGACATGPTPKPETTQQLQQLDEVTLIVDFVREQRVGDHLAVVDVEGSLSDRATFTQVVSETLAANGYQVGGTFLTSGLFHAFRTGMSYQRAADGAPDQSLQPPFDLDIALAGELEPAATEMAGRLAHYNILEGNAAQIPQARDVANGLGGRPLFIVAGDVTTISNARRVASALLGALGAPVGGPPPNWSMYLFVVDATTGNVIWGDGAIWASSPTPSHFRKGAEQLLGKIPHSAVAGHKAAISAPQP